jgi:nitroreductase
MPYVGGAVAVVALLAGAFLADASWQGRPVRVDKDTSLPFDLPESVREALYYASLAPSSHNAQMWSVRAYPEAGRLAVAVDGDRVLAVTDPEGREALISLGCFVENLVRALEAFGHDVAVTVAEPEAGAPRDVAATWAESQELVVVDYSGGSPTPGAVRQDELQVMLTRHTEKSPTTTRPLPDAAVAALFPAAGANPHWVPRSSPAFAYLAEATVAATVAANGRQAVRDELAAWLRFSDDEALREKDGLPAEQLGMTGLKKSFYYLFFDREQAQGDKFAAQGNDQAKAQAEGGAGFVVITGENTLAGLVAAGRTTEAFWLAATARGVSVHPMSALLETTGGPAAAQEYLGLASPVQMLLSVGLLDGDYGQNAAIRRPLADFVRLGE